MTDLLASEAPPDLETRVPIARRFGSLLRLAVAVLLCLTPLGAVLVLGWLMRMMARERAVVARRLADTGTKWPRPSLPNWVVGTATQGQSRRHRWFGGMIENIRLGLASLLTLALGTFPFSLLWLFSWWGGWENSFNKGYEQAWVGPALGLLGVGIALPLLTRLPMALAHQAAEGRISAFFAFGHVRRLTRQVGWRYVFLCFLIVLSAFPLFAAKSAPVFVENWSPGFLSRNAAEVEAFASGYRLAATAYLLLVLVIWRRAAARLHARASHRLDGLGTTGARASWLGTALRGLLLGAIWFVLVAQIYVGQFVNHQWLAWINHPVLVLPWIPQPGSVL